MRKIAWLLGCLGLTACASGPPAVGEAPAAAAPAQDDPTAGTTWLRSLDGKPAATFEDGLRAAAVLVDPPLVAQPWTTIKGRLMQRGIVPSDWNYLPASTLSKGQLAYFLVEALRLDGGVMLNILSNTRRYAFRECQAQGLIVGSFHEEVVTGNELLSILAKADVYQRERTLDSVRRP
jgi:hypothetical protein